MHKSLPKISVVIPAYNEAQVIIPTLEAILAQDYDDFEVIVVDNASTDETSVIVKAFFVEENIDQKKAKIVLETKKGLLHARERGRKEATGHIVANMDADCMPDKDWLKKVARYFDGCDVDIKNPLINNTPREIVAVSGPYDYYDGEPFFRITSLLMQKYIYKIIAEILQSPMVKGGAVMIGGNNAIRADILEKMGGYNTSLLFYGEDTDTAKRVSQYGRIAFSHKITMKTSARRFKKEGTLKMTGKYFYHFFKHTFKGI